MWDEDTIQHIQSRTGFVCNLVLGQRQSDTQQSIVPLALYSKSHLDSHVHSFLIVHCLQLYVLVEHARLSLFSVIITPQTHPAPSMSPNASASKFIDSILARRTGEELIGDRMCLKLIDESSSQHRQKVYLAQFLPTYGLSSSGGYQTWKQFNDTCDICTLDLKMLCATALASSVVEDSLWLDHCLFISSPTLRPDGSLQIVLQGAALMNTTDNDHSMLITSRFDVMTGNKVPGEALIMATDEANPQLVHTPVFLGATVRYDGIFNQVTGVHVPLSEDSRERRGSHTD